MFLKSKLFNSNVNDEMSIVMLLSSSQRNNSVENTGRIDYDRKINPRDAAIRRKSENNNSYLSNDNFKK